MCTVEHCDEQHGRIKSTPKELESCKSDIGQVSQEEFLEVATGRNYICKCLLEQEVYLCASGQNGSFKMVFESGLR